VACTVFASAAAQKKILVRQAKAPPAKLECERKHSGEKIWNGSSLSRLRSVDGECLTAEAPLLGAGDLFSAPGVAARWAGAATSSDSSNRLAAHERRLQPSPLVFTRSVTGGIRSEAGMRNYEAS
jgi:hypothetical protein